MSQHRGNDMITDDPEDKNRHEKSLVAPDRKPDALEATFYKDEIELTPLADEEVIIYD